MNIFIGSDHAGIELKKNIVDYLTQYKVDYLKNKNLNIIDLGPFNSDSVDYPDYANLVCAKIKTESDFGILICGSGQGMMMRANKFSNIRAALVYNDDIAKLSREHNNANIICLGSKFCTAENAQNWVSLFINTKFSEGRHALRVAKLSTPVV